MFGNSASKVYVRANSPCLLALCPKVYLSERKWFVFWSCKSRFLQINVDPGFSVSGSTFVSKRVSGIEPCTTPRHTEITELPSSSAWTASLVGQPPPHSHSITSSPALRAYKPECYGACQLSGPPRENYGELASSLAPTGPNLCQKECQIECQPIDRSTYLSYHLTIYIAIH